MERLGKKRKFMPSRELGNLLLELAGYEDGLSSDEMVVEDAAKATHAQKKRKVLDQKDVERLHAEAKQLKRKADGAKESPDRYVMYLKSGLLFLEMPCMNTDPVEHLGSTAELFEYVAKKTHAQVRQGLKLWPNDDNRLDSYGYLCILAYRVSSIIRMQRFYEKSSKLKLVWDACKQYQHERDKKQRAGSLSTNESKLGEEEYLYRTRIINQGEDAVSAAAYWKIALELERDIKKRLLKFGKFDQSKYDVLPGFPGPFTSLEELRDLPSALSIL